MGVAVSSHNPGGPRDISELVATRHPEPERMQPYELVLTEAMEGDESIFARQDYVEEAWRIVDPVLKADTPVFQYDPHTWGPKEAEALTPPGGWVDPVVDPAPTSS
jgi:glucose-6-phosphate 1-dehydrogenase